MLELEGELDSEFDSAIDAVRSEGEDNTFYVVVIVFL
jgi:hypothetical protein